MAQISSTILSGSILLPTTENTSSAGNIWFDGTNVKYSTLGARTWSSITSLITARQTVGGFGCDSDTATVAAGYDGTGVPSGWVSQTEEYNGSSWSTGGNMTQGRSGVVAVGSQNSGLIGTGTAYPTAPTCNCTEEYNGSSWSSGGNLITGRYSGGGAGTQNAAITVGGYAGGASTLTEEYNGTSWASGGNMPSGFYYNATSGTQNATLNWGGTTGPPSYPNNKVSYEYNGSSWTTGPNFITTRTRVAGVGAGTQNSSLAYGGGYAPSFSTATEEYDGTSWSSLSSNTITSRDFGAGNGVSTSAFLAGGRVSPSSRTSNAEIFEQGPLTACTL